ncbi:MAG: dihydrolipoyl dehydrogenase [Opitutales bacterium]|nr:dihydrolipoyl dehydrogenase [Opitutales bacterium]NRA26859.1 dihydrolipoyl dehydrogenase [Opitutales bacterium]
MANQNSYDLAVIGGGPAGYAAAIRAGQLGKKVACIEMERAGGTCLNWGCIPSKALLKSAELYQSMLHAEDLGLSAGEIGYDFDKIIQRSRGVADTMAKGIEFLFKKNKVDYIRGKAKIEVPGMIEITDGEAKGQFINASKILIATGAKPRLLPGLEADNEAIFTSREALVMKKQPKSIVIMGAGAIGCEFAYFLNSFGTQVTLVEMLDQVLPVEDADCADVVSKTFKKSGIDVRTGTKAENITKTKSGVKLDLVKGDKSETVEAEALLVSIGVVANTKGLLSNKVKLKEFKGYLTVDDTYETSTKGIYAAGDIIGPPWLAHIATYEAIQAVNGMFGAGKPHKYDAFPGCTYCQPQVASIGKTEKQCKEEGLDVKIGKFPFMASGKAVASNHPEGFVKVITDKKYGEVIGAHIVGSDATELIAEYALAMNLEATTDEIHHTIHAHPTLSEALMEAAAAVTGEAIHI